MKIRSSFKEYELIIQKDFMFIEKLKELSGSFWVIDRQVYELYNKELFNNIKETDLYLVDALEDNKTVDTALEICEIMTKIPAKRNAQLISIGGGIIQDITGFVANILYRGIKWEFVPTTLLAGCDSCIGGKTSLNYKKYKNLLGTFYPPDHIHVCSKFFHTLTDKDFKSGLGEVVKFNVMFGEEGISRIEKNIDNLIARDEETVNKFVENSLLFKKDFIEADEFDKGERIKLNFAHTFGHGFETVTNYAIPHGTAVAIGTLVANRVSLMRGLLDEKEVVRIEEVIKKIVNINFDSLKFDIDKLIDAIRKDKKQIDTNITAVLMYDDMKLRIYHDLQQDEIEKAIKYVFGYLNDWKG